jgi:hypothetical protein
VYPIVYWNKTESASNYLLLVNSYVNSSTNQYAVQTFNNDELQNLVKAEAEKKVLNLKTIITNPSVKSLDLMLINTQTRTV